MRTLLALVIASLTAACTATGVPRLARGDRVVTGGSFMGTVKMNGWYGLGPYLSLNRDCSVSSRARLRILEAPANGRVSIESRKGQSGFSPDSPMAHCDTIRHTGPMLVYYPRKGFTGQDRYTFEIVFQDGERRVITPILDVVR